jgi:hypothetical protein
VDLELLGRAHLLDARGKALDSGWMQTMLTRIFSQLLLLGSLAAFAPAKADEGWISLFDGKTFDGWKVGENADSFSIRDGAIFVDGPRAHLFYVGPVGNANFKDFEFQADVMTFPQANSGVFFHTEYQEGGWPSKGYEAQVNATQRDRIKTGSVYGVKNVMDEAPHKDNEWFNYRIRVEGKKVTLWVDDKVVNEYVEPDDVRGGRRLSSGTFALQAHDPNSRIAFKNIKVRIMDDAGDSAKFVPIFNGKDLSGWEGKPGFWRVEEGAIVAETTPDNPTEGNTFLIWREGELDDFELKLKFRVASERANSGIQFRSEDLGNHVVKGYQSDIATEDWITGIIYEERGRGILARRGQKVEAGDGPNHVKVMEEFAESLELGKKIKEEWNEYHLIARGNEIKQKINGELMAWLIDKGEKDGRRSGILALQLHSGPPMKVLFKDIELKRLKLAEGNKKVVMVAGTPSHGYAAHEHNAGTLLFQKLLHKNVPNVLTTIYHNGWPKDPTAFDNADAILVYSNGGGGHPILPRLEEVDKIMKRGVGLLCVHYAVEVPKGDPGEYFLDWIGGYFEPHWSVNPHWTLEKSKIADGHPITRGVRPYVIYDEWYYHMRFQENMDGVTAILTATPPESTLNRPDGAHSGNPHVRAKKGEPQHLVWARERPDGGRGFGFTGGHDHWNWGHPDHLRIVLNAIVWAAGGEVPAGGVPFQPPTLEELEVNQDYPPPDNFNRERIRKRLEEWQGRAVSVN